MSVSQVLRKLGSWNVQLVAGAPDGILNDLDYFGHVAIIPGRLNPVERGDELLRLARYVGVLRSVEVGDQMTLSGPGMAMWLGDENGLGDVIETPGITLTAVTYAAAIRALLPANGAITEGTLHGGVPGTYTGAHMYQTPRAAIDYVSDLMGGEWRVNGDGTLDAGPASTLFRTTPEVVVVRTGAGYDVTLKALPGALDTTRDASTYTTRVVLVAVALAGGTADAPTVPYNDIHGNPVHITRVIDEQDETTVYNAPARASAALQTYNTIRNSLRLSAEEFDIPGDISPGDTIWCYDPAGGLSDPAVEVEFRGRVINPVAVRCLSLTWPVEQGYTVAYRSSTGAWTDLTPWVEWESPGGGEIEVADSQATALTSSVGTSGTQVVGGGRANGDTSVPGVPVFGAFTTTSYQPGDGLSRAAVHLSWTEPLNTDASTIVDGDHYEIRYRPTGSTDWATTYAAFDQLTTTVADLPPSTGFDWQIRAVDYYSPVNYGAWSGTTTFATSDDVTAPATPAPPAVAASLIAVQVTHTCGLATGGTYNLPLDLDHFEVHVDPSSSFTATTATLVGKLRADRTNLAGSIPAVGTFPIDLLVPAGSVAYVRVVAVDRTGNRSTASSAASATAQLIDSAHITSLTASKITAGTITAAVVIGGSATFSGALSAATGTFAGSLSAATGTFSGALSGATGTFSGSLSAASGTFTGALSGATGNFTGTVQTGSSGTQRIILDPTGTPTIYFRPASGSDYEYINSPSGGGLGMNSGNNGGAYRTRVLLSPGLGELNSIDASQVQVGGRLYVTQTDASVTSNNGPVSVRSDTGTLTCTSAGNARFSSDGTYAIFGNGSNSYVQTSGTDVTVNANNTANLQTSGTGVNLTTTTITLNCTALKSTGIPNGSTGNHLILNGTQIYYVPSSRAMKTEIEYGPSQLSWDNLAQLKPVTYYDKREHAESAGDRTLCSWQLGLIAEDVDALPDGLGEMLAGVDGEGRPNSVRYDRLGVLLAPLVMDLHERLKALESA